MCGNCLAIDWHNALAACGLQRKAPVVSQLFRAENWSTMQLDVSINLPPRMFGPARCRPAKCFAAVAGRWEVPSLACCLLARHVRGVSRKSAAEAWEAAQRRPSPMEQAAIKVAKVTPKWLSEAAKDAADDSEVEVIPDGVPGASKANFSRIYAREEWDGEALSGLGSREETTREFRNFLEGFLQEHGVNSVVDAGCGHWPSGYQRFMNWQNVQYTGVDVVPYVVDENTRYFQDEKMLSSHGLRSAQFMCGDVSENLPEGDLLLVKVQAS
eukprot:symbB.v1.2.035888.t1/scaffold4941.1/size32609/3